MFQQKTILWSSDFIRHYPVASNDRADLLLPGAGRGYKVAQRVRIVRRVIWRGEPRDPDTCWHWHCNVHSDPLLTSYQVIRSSSNVSKLFYQAWTETMKVMWWYFASKFKDRTLKPNTFWANAILMARYVSLNSHNLCKSRLILLWWICMPCAPA